MLKKFFNALNKFLARDGQSILEYLLTYGSVLVLVSVAVYPLASKLKNPTGGGGNPSATLPDCNTLPISCSCSATTCRGLSCPDDNCPSRDCIGVLDPNCSENLCGGAAPNGCGAADECGPPKVCPDDGNPCTQNAGCNPSTGSCEYPAIADHASCTDPTNLCQPKECVSGTCLDLAPILCTAQVSNDCIASGACNPITGLCIYTSEPNGTNCDDGDPCTEPDTCNGSGSCVGTSMSCNLPPDPQCYDSNGTCLGGACSYAKKADETVCNDANLCTTDDHCQSGTCTGTSMTCNTPPDTQCYDPNGTCSDGSCFYTMKSKWTDCDDGDPCTDNDKCSNGVCSGTDITCNHPPDNQCYSSDGICSGGTCSYTPLPDETACHDGIACTENDKCSNGTCSGTAIPCDTPPNTQCYKATGTCSGGACSYTTLPEGTACDDGDACTEHDSCNNSGSCTGTAITCNLPPNTQCYNSPGTCSGGACSYTMKADGIACIGSDLCTEHNVCSNGICSGGTAITCDTPPNTQCYNSPGTCSGGACSYPTLPNETACDDGNPSTENDVCSNGTCSGETGTATADDCANPSTFTWGTHCSDTITRGTWADGTKVTIMNSAPGYTGFSYYTCTNGFWVADPTPAATCTAN